MSFAVDSAKRTEESAAVADDVELAVTLVVEAKESIEDHLQNEQ